MENGMIVPEESGGDDGVTAKPATLLLSAEASCSYRMCKKTSKSGPEDAFLRNCANNGCPKTIHRACSVRLLDTIGCGGHMEPTVCGKRCLNAINKRSKQSAVVTSSTKKRVLWHNDGPTESISSLSCLIDWMTTGANYSRYRGGEGQNGETKMSIAGEIVRYLSECGIATARTSKDIITKISQLESSYRCAADWLTCTGSGVQDEESLRTGILSRCAEYYELFPVMDERPSVRPLLLNTDLMGSSESIPSDVELGPYDASVDDSDASMLVDHNAVSEQVHCNGTLSTTVPETRHTRLR